MSKIIDLIKQDLTQREQKGLDTYGTTVDRKDLTTEQWMQHLYEELLDAAVYIKKLKEDHIEVSENTSDGYHTFKELYDFRRMYNAALFNEWAANHKHFVHKSFKHHDGEVPFGNNDWFIVVAMLPTGQISNHYERKYWNMFQVPEYDRALFPYDGHTSADVLKRLDDLIKFKK
jgi:hypothetical protein